MNIKNFADLEYSKQLKDLFPKAESWWIPSYSWNQRTEDFTYKSYVIEEGSRYTSHPKFTNQGGQWYSEEDKKLRRTLFQRWEDRLPAITTDMLLERLPEQINDFYLCIRKIAGSYEVNYNDYEIDGDSVIEVSYKREMKQGVYLPNVLAKMLIWLKKENL